MSMEGVSRLRRALLRRLPAVSPRRAGIDVPRRVGETAPLLRRMLFENCLPFWFPSCVDERLGGYSLSRDWRGRQIDGAATRSIVGQARMVWFFSRLVAGGHGGPEHLAAAAHGYRFLRDRMWDAEHGGFHWSVDVRSGRPVRDAKHLYGQAFALFALSRYAAVSGDLDAAALARIHAHLVRNAAHDPVHGGYFELFTRDWRPSTGMEHGYLSEVPAGTKRYNTHLHWFEALLEYADLSGGEEARPWLSELVDILTDRVVRRDHAACTDAHSPDWSPMPGLVNYGHDVEAVWMLRDAERRTGLVGAERLAAHRRLFGSALRHGWDARHGGFFWAGPPGRPATMRGKDWWVQAEGLVAALILHFETGDACYADCYLRMLDWIANIQVDWTCGEWHREIAVNGRPLGDKGDGWKNPYHNGRAMMICLEMLEAAGAA